MKSSELRLWLENQEAEHGDLNIACMTAYGNLAECEELTPRLLSVTKPLNLAIDIKSVGNDEKIIAIGFDTE
ncbi:hypothetical protein [Pantoea sp. CFSAN033090]|uniref:hypothetical protein n=1 Tax=Pantoea sp. CFSAN033090 TaxID=1690502 RepID=UPI000690F9A4|nr:hypothetical protein [Pantoea sp. CFSAN033090]KOA68690.1 hypothetical protein AFL22_19775 [Pantoea sp. CFSAN033090]